MSWWDRVLARPVGELPSDATPGRYLIRAAEPTLVSGVSARQWDHLAAGALGRWSVAVGGGETRRGQFPPAERLRSLEAGALSEIADRLAPESVDRFDWVRLAKGSPLVHPTPEQLEATRVDLEINRHGPHLLEVCRRPHSILDAVVEPTLASRAKRIPPRAVHYLAGHSEDWHRRTVMSVVPRRVLAQRVDERLDVYENRVVARLVDEILDYFRERLADLRDLRDMLTDVADFSGALSAQHRVARRLSELWGEGFGEENDLDRVRHLELVLLDQRRRIAGLRDCALYRAVPRKADVGAELRHTNVLLDHQHYRRVAELWRAAVQGQASDATRQDEYDAWQSLMRAFDTFCLMLVVASVHRLGFKVPGVTALDLRRRTTVALSGPYGSLDVEWDPIRGVTLTTGGGGPTVRFVPLAASLCGIDEGASEANERRARLRACELASARTESTTGALTVVMYHATRRQRGAFALDPQFNADDAGLVAAPGRYRARLLPVSPLDILSLERVERVVRRVVLIYLLEGFPPTSECRRNVRERVASLAEWVDLAESRDHLSVTSPPEEPRLGKLSRAIKSEQSGLRPRQDDAVRNALSAALVNIEAAKEYFDQLRRCPVCTSSGEFLSRGTAHFVVECGACGSSWGMDACGKCSARVPYLDVGATSDEGNEDFVLDLLDRTFGRDVLAAPCVQAGSDEQYVCPSCTACAGSDQSCGPNCARPTAPGTSMASSA